MDTPFRGGRGGAGNFVWPDRAAQATLEREKREKEERKEEEVKGKVEKDVEEALARPGSVYLVDADEGRGSGRGRVGLIGSGVVEDGDGVGVGAEGWERV